MTTPPASATPSPAKYPRHTRADVVAAAMQILDQYGLADLTMRRLASTLDIQPSALYWHVTNKQTLLALMADRILDRADAGEPSPAHEQGPAAVEVGDGWQSATRRQATALRDALLAYRDGAEVVSTTLALGLGAESAQERLAAAVATGGFDGRTSALAAATLLHFVLGHAWHEQQRMQADSLGVVTSAATLQPDHATTAPDAPDGFDFGITLLLDGLTAHAHTTPSPPSRP